MRNEGAMRIAKVFVALSAALMCSALHAQATLSLGGYTLGDYFDSSRAQQTIDAGAYRLYEVRGSDALLPSARYLLTLTRGGQIRQVSAMRDVADMSECNQRAARLWKNLVATHGLQDDPVPHMTMSGGSIYSGTVGRAEISVVCGHNGLELAYMANWFGSQDFK